MGKSGYKIEGKKPLHLAGEPEIIELLLNEGADIDGEDSNGWAPIHYAAYNPPLMIGSLENVDILGRNPDPGRWQERQ